MAVPCKSLAILLVSIVVIGIHASASGVAAFQGYVGLAHSFFHLDKGFLPIPFGEDNTVLVANLAATATSAVTKMATTVTANTEIEIESEVLQDASHLFLDFSVFVTQSKQFLKMAQIVGRLLLLIQDYLPDRHVAPEELGVQVLMIAMCLSKRSSCNNNGNNNSKLS
jgi:hypothetical protein